MMLNAATAVAPVSIILGASQGGAARRKRRCLPGCRHRSSARLRQTRVMRARPRPSQVIAVLFAVNIGRLAGRSRLPQYGGCRA